jgi:hypothetical protein
MAICAHVQPACRACRTWVLLKDLCHWSEAQHAEQSKLRVFVGCETDQPNGWVGGHGDSRKREELQSQPTALVLSPHALPLRVSCTAHQAALITEGQDASARATC